MQGGLYVGLSGQIALQQRLETIAHNVANASTAGFRAEEVKFETVLSRVPTNPVAFSSAGSTYLSRSTGDIVRTDDPFDVAVQGDVWLSIDVAGKQVYTRDGRMMMSPNGDVQTLSGHSVLDVGGAPIVLNPAGGVPQISRDGTITQNGQQLGAIGLHRIEEGAKLTRAEQFRRHSRPPGGACARFLQCRGAAGLHGAGQRQSGDGDYPPYRSAPLVRRTQRCHGYRRRHAENRHSRARPDELEHFPACPAKAGMYTGSRREPTFVIPAKAGIQYSALTLVFTGSPPSRG